MDDIILEYSGSGAILWGVPTRDLTDADVEECGRTVEELIASGLYLPADPRAIGGFEDKGVSNG